MLSGLLSALIAGSLVSVQNIFNSKVNEHVSSWATTAWVLGLGALASLVLGLVLEGPQMFALKGMQPWYWGSGILGVGVVIGLVQSIRRLGPTYAVSIVMAAQLAFAVLWDGMGWLGMAPVPISPKRLLGVLVIVGGVLVFKLCGTQKSATSPEPAGVR
ncbi:DMT family transporter [bacterium]|nr:DMT family transporter [bacterium]